MTKRQKWLLGVGLGAIGCATAAGVQLLRAKSGPEVAEDSNGRPLSCIQDIALGIAHTCFLFRNGRVHCFGNDFSNGAGAEDIDVKALDRDPVKTDERFASIAAAQGDTCGISRKDASLWCWGKQTKDGYRQPSEFIGAPPVRFDAFGTDNVQVSLAADRVFVVKRDGSLWFQKFDPRPPVHLLEGVSRVYASNYFACAKMRDQTVQCWGNNDAGQLGRGTVGNAGLAIWGEAPAPIAGEGREFETLRLLGETACGMTASREVWCWGSADHSAFGDGRYYSDGQNVENYMASRPQKLTLPMKVRDYQLVGLALAEDGSVWNWGPANFNPVLVDTVEILRDRLKTKVVLHPQKLAQLGQDNARIFMMTHACVQKNDASVWCWGDNRGRQVSRKVIHDEAGIHRIPVNCPTD